MKIIEDEITTLTEDLTKAISFDAAECDALNPLSYNELCIDRDGTARKLTEIGYRKEDKVVEDIRELIGNEIITIDEKLGITPDKNICDINKVQITAYINGMIKALTLISDKYKKVNK